MTRVWTITLVGSLGLACARGEQLWSRQGQELQAEYEERQQDADDCLASFGLCLADAPDDEAVAGCADELQSCLAVGLPGEEEDENPFDGDSEGDDPGVGEDDGEDDEPQDDEPQDDEPPLGAECQPILELCLADPGNFDPFCLDDFEECIEVAVAFELQELCNEIEAKCLELEIPNFDCFDVCG
jgi:hypothetical protein